MANTKLDSWARVLHGLDQKSFRIDGAISTMWRAPMRSWQFEQAWRRIGEAMTAAETTKEKWREAEIHRTAGDIVLMLPAPEAAKAQAF